MLTNGCTNPVRGTLEDSTLTIAKLFNNDMGNLTLVNEYICYNLTTLLDLPSTPSGICVCDNNTIDSCNCLDKKNYGPSFYSTYLDKSTHLKQGIIRLLSNINDFYRLVLFDHIVYNKDRNIFNLLTTYSKNNISFKLIDHSHVFKNETIWDSNCFMFGIKDFDITDTVIMESNMQMYSMFFQSMNFDFDSLCNETQKFKDAITNESLRNIILSVPDEWGVQKSDFDSLVDYVLYRVENVDKICDVIRSFYNQFYRKEV